MPDSKQVQIQDRRVGAKGLASGVSPLINDKSKFWDSNNVIFDYPGLASRRRGIQDLDHTNHYSSLSGLSTSYLPKKTWCFDNHVFHYLEDSTHGAIAAYDLIGSSWQIVYSAGPKLEMDSGIHRVMAKAFDRTSIVLTNTGPKRLSALYGNSGTSQYNYSTSFRDAGVPRALDPRCRNAAAGGATDHGFVNTPNYNWLTDPNNTGKAAVAYRVCFIYRDENGVLITGAPSGRMVVRNTTGTAFSVRIKVPIPSGMTNRYVMQVYRTNVMGQDGTGGIPDPGDDMFLTGEYQLTSTDLSNGYALYLDISFDGILGSELYTNVSQDGPDQARFQPPVARTIDRFGNCSWLGNVTERQRLTIKVLAVDSSGVGTFPGIRVGDRIHAGGLVMEGVLVAAEDTQPYNFAVDVTTGSGSEVIRVLKTAESFVYKYNLLSNQFKGRYYAYNLTSNDDIFGVIGFEEKSVGGSYKCFCYTNRFDSPTSILPFPSISGYNGAYLGLSTMSGLAINVGATVATITTPVNPGIPAVGDKIIIAPGRSCYASGASDPVFVSTGLPSGEYTILSNNGSTQITIDITGAGANSGIVELLDATHEAWVALSYNSVSGSSAFAVSSGPNIKNRVYWSSPGEFESAPISNFKDFGNADSAVQSIISTTSSIYILKDDGVWRGRGTDGSWQFEYMDPACHIVAPYSAAVVSGDVYCYSNNGMVRISEGGVTKISTEIGAQTDSYMRSVIANPVNAYWMEGIANEEDQTYIISVPNALFVSNVATGSTTLYRYHVPSKTWSFHTFATDNASGPSNGRFSSLCMAKATRYDPAASSIVYINRMVVAYNSVANSIGIERRNATFQDYCDFDMGYQTISSYDTVNHKVVMAASIPASTQVGDVFWARNSSAPNTSFRLPITAISTTSVFHDTITVGTGGTMPALGTFPAVGTVQAVFMQQIPTRITYSAVLVSDGFSTSHMSDSSFVAGSGGKFTDIVSTFTTDTNSTISTVTTSGFATANWSNLGFLQSVSPSMMKLVGFSVLVPQEAQRASVSFVKMTSGHAWEPFDIAAFQISMFGESKIRRSVGS